MIKSPQGRLKGIQDDEAAYFQPSLAGLGRPYESNPGLAPALNSTVPTGLDIEMELEVEGCRHTTSSPSQEPGLPVR